MLCLTIVIPKQTNGDNLYKHDECVEYETFVEFLLYFIGLLVTYLSHE